MNPSQGFPKSPKLCYQSETYSFLLKYSLNLTDTFKNLSFNKLVLRIKSVTMTTLTFLTCIIISYLTLYSHTTIAQTNNSIPADTTKAAAPYFDKTLHGGFTIGARVGGNSYLYFSPFIGLRLGKFYPGIGVSFSQYIQNDPYIKDQRIGLRGLIRYQLHKNFFSSVEYDGQKNSIITEKGYVRKWTNNILMGAGIAIPVTYDSKLTFELLYQVNYKPGQSPYGHKQMLGRVGFAF